VALLRTPSQRTIVQETAALADRRAWVFSLHGMLHDEGESHVGELMLHDRPGPWVQRKSAANSGWMSLTVPASFKTMRSETWLIVRLSLTLATDPER